MSSFDADPDREPQIELGHLLQRLKGNAEQRTFEEFKLSSPYDKPLQVSAGDRHARLTRSEYIILWGLMSVSDSRSATTNFLSLSQIHDLLTSVLRESRPLLKKQKDSKRLPANWIDEDDLSYNSANLQPKSSRIILHRLRTKLEEVFAGRLTIENEGRSPWGYCLKVREKDKRPKA